ncbi:hypothetical protein GCM10010512_49570 [Streptomyces thermoviolaceus subsp. thermoviolaceus]|uniref:Amidohydrolase-related domain-containing protein n=1 Tax=Streptomyces thermoviolaceus subsp. thermoviolaceus TaxID=66860 RepID=A0ABX0Z0X4_STRTL|nr:DUF6282 family protein [Streptomyces thermoviolaceus]NJP16996.1 hypothetical protein [Streptomyces thermoviolaceus subsp. thermoviolaceus]WTD46783.1 DUF6282 family protein [Streptomyces thermoviolaceus]GHB12304.1 hypothetical protein GCM10010512_49570 [Streptomyces thermoviolaceus subsp. thermoviolaceus]
MRDLARQVVDVHYHAGPDLYRRRLTVGGAGRAYAGLDGWAVVKSHLASTAASAWEARQEGLPVSGAVVLNEVAGGVHPRVVEQAVYAHGPDSPARLLVHLPTMVASGHRSALRREPFHPMLEVDRWRTARVLEAPGRLRRAVREVLVAAKDLPVAVATGHCDREETLRLVDEAVRLGLPRLLLTHATHPMSGLTVEDVSQLADVPGLYVEFTALTLLLGHRDARHLGALVRAHPRTVFSSDLGQPDQPEPGEWLRLSRDWFEHAGLTAHQVRAVTGLNPAGLLSP